MTPQDEKKSLITNPLPSDAMVYATCESSLVLPNIAYLTEAIESEQNHITYLQKQLDILKSRAISENLRESGNYYLVEIPGKKMRNPITDIPKFKCGFPDGYERIREEQKDLITSRFTTDMLNVEDSGIPLTLADRKVGKDLVTEFVGFQLQPVTIEVRRKQERLG